MLSNSLCRETNNRSSHFWDILFPEVRKKNIIACRRVVLAAIYNHQFNVFLEYWPFFVRICPFFCFLLICCFDRLNPKHWPQTLGFLQRFLNFDEMLVDVCRLNFSAPKITARQSTKINNGETNECNTRKASFIVIKAMPFFVGVGIIIRRRCFGWEGQQLYYELLQQT